MCIRDSIEGERIATPPSGETEKDKLSYSYPSSSSPALGRGGGRELDKGLLGYYIEVTVAHIATQRAIKPAIKLGKYCYTWVPPFRSHPGPPTCPPYDTVDGSSASPPSQPNHHSGSKGGGGGVGAVGDTVDDRAGRPLPLRPDCVEVVVREIMDALLYGECPLPPRYEPWLSCSSSDMYGPMGSLNLERGQCTRPSKHSVTAYL